MCKVDGACDNVIDSFHTCNSTKFNTAWAHCNIITCFRRTNVRVTRFTHRLPQFDAASPSAVVELQVSSLVIFHCP